MLSLVRSFFCDASRQGYTEILDLRPSFFIFVPEEIILQIFKNLEISTLISLNLTNRRFNKITNSNILWEPFVKSLHLQHSKKNKDSYKKTFSNHCTRIKIVASKEKDLLYVKEALKNLNSINDIAHLSKCLRSRDKLIMWKGFAMHIGEESQIYTKKTDIDTSKQFGNWIASHNLTLYSLKEMCFSHASLSSIPSELCLFHSLTSLDLSKNYIEKLPRQLGLLTNLTSLKLSKNRIKRLPISLIMMEKLKKLKLSNNELESISKISFLTNLKELNLSNNRLTKLPPTLKNCVHLKKLAVSNNSLIELPACISSFSRLEKLTVSVDQLSMPLKEIAENLKISIKIESSKTDSKIVVDDIKT